MKLYGSKRSFPRSFPPGPSLRFRAALVAGSAMTGLWEPARSAGASPGGLTAGTVGLGPKAWDEVFAPASAPGVLALRPDRHVADLYSKQPLLLRSAFPRRVGRWKL